jgi:hypothetical protein
MNEPIFDYKDSWSFTEIKNWLDQYYPGYVVPMPNMGSFMCFRPDGTLYAYSKIAGGIGYIKKAAS